MTDTRALYRKYRSKKLSEVVGQDHITKTLANALKKGQLSHAYLFTGPRGVGKTSVARILAHEINELPYDDQTHLDIIEIDAASNRRIDEIRDLRDKVHVAPTSAKHKVYIIDEVHMLTKEAFNALLKTLEEPPAHVVFILATTEPHRLPETIISRTQRHSFRPIEKSLVIDHLKTIAEREKIKVDDAALELIAEHGEGSFRDSISMLDQVRSSGQTVTAAVVEQLLGLAPVTIIESILETTERGNAQKLVEQLDDLYAQGMAPPLVARQLIEQLRGQVVKGQTQNLSLLDELLTVPAAADPQLKLELVLLKATLQHAPADAPAAKVVETKPAEAAVPTPSDKPVKKATQEKPKTARPAPENTRKLEDKQWQQLLEVSKQHNAGLHTLLRMAEARLSDDGAQLVLAFRFPFHQKRASEARHAATIATIAEEVLSTPVEVIALVDEGLKPPDTLEADDKAKRVIDTFGGGEVINV